MKKALLLFELWNETKKGKDLEVIQCMPGIIIPLECMPSEQRFKIIDNYILLHINIRFYVKYM